MKTIFAVTTSLLLFGATAAQADEAGAPLDITPATLTRAQVRAELDEARARGEPAAFEATNFETAAAAKSRAEVRDEVRHALANGEAVRSGETDLPAAPVRVAVRFQHGG
jgi:hypothetical protein